MTDRHDAGSEAYRRLKYAEQHRPSPEEMEQLAKEQIEAERRARQSRFRRSIA